MKLVLKLTNSCNYSCAYCYLNKSKELGEVKDSAHPMTFEQVVSYISQALIESRDEIINVSFFGGEPLMEWQTIQKTLLHFNEHAQKNRLHYSLTTNGALLSEKRILFLAEYPISITISLDDINTREYIYKRIAFVTSIEKKLQKSMLAIRVAFANPKVNLIDWHKKLYELGVRKIHLMPLTSKVYNYHQFNQNYKEYLGFIQREPQLIQTNAQINYFLNKLNQFHLEDEFCQLGQNYLAISNSGKYYPCTGFLDMEQFRLADEGARFSDVSLEAEEFNQKTRVQLREDYQSCWAKSLCGGNCRHAQYLVNGDINASILGECEFMKMLAEFCIDLQAQADASDQVDPEIGYRGFVKINPLAKITSKDNLFVMVGDSPETFVMSDLQAKALRACNGRLKFDELIDYVYGMQLFEFEANTIKYGHNEIRQFLDSMKELGVIEEVHV